MGDAKVIEYQRLVLKKDGERPCKIKMGVSQAILVVEQIDRIKEFVQKSINRSYTDD